MESQELVLAWLALEDLFTEPAMNARLTEVFSDESAHLLQQHLFEMLMDDQWDGSTFQARGEEFLASLTFLLRRGVARVEAEDAQARWHRMLECAGELLRVNQELASLFTIEDGKAFLRALLSDTSNQLKELDQYTGVYLTLKVVEELVPTFATLALLQEPLPGHLNAELELAKLSVES